MSAFKQFLLEGGRATAKHGTVRANQADVHEALRRLAQVTGLTVTELAANLLGSARLTHQGLRADSGDVDVALEDKGREAILRRMTQLAGEPPYVIGGSTYSYALPVGHGRKVQLDLMFVPDLAWARFSHYASAHSAHKSGVRNELLHAVLKFTMKPGQDLRLQDHGGHDIVRASRSYKLDRGVERIFKVAPLRKDGKGRVKTTVKATPDEVQAALDAVGHKGRFSREVDTIRDPDAFARLLFGDGVRGKDLLSTEQVIARIKKHRPKAAAAILRDAVKGIKRLKFKVPAELKAYDTETQP